MCNNRLFAMTLGLGLLASGHDLVAQERVGTLLVLVEYIAGANLYLSAGSDSGLVAGDTLVAVRPGEAREGRLRVISATAERSVVTFAGTAFPVTRGDSLRLTIRAYVPGAPNRAAVPGAAVDSQAAAPPPVRSGAQRPSANRREPARPARPARPPRLDGTLAFDMDALESETRWGEQPGETTDRRFMTPAVRLYATLSDLPGDFKVSTNLRYEYRYATTSGLDQVTALRVYQASIEKDFERLPLQLRFGRFYNPADLYGGYWDGASVRIGGRVFGIGAAAGFEPDRVNGGPDTDATKTSVFTDLMLRGPSADWQAGVVVHQDRTADGRTERFISGSQRLRVGRATLLHRMRLDAAQGWGDWSVTQLHVIAVTPLVGRLLARGHYARRSFDWQPLEPDTVRPHNERRGAGLLYSGSNLSLSGDASLTDWTDGGSARTYSASIAVQRTFLAGLGFGVAATRWESDDGYSDYLSPSITRRFGRGMTSVSWQRYRTAGPAISGYDAASLMLSFPLPGGMFSSLRLQTQWGDRTSSNRVFTSLWKSF